MPAPSTSSSQSQQNSVQEHQREAGQSIHLPSVLCTGPGLQQLSPTEQRMGAFWVKSCSSTHRSQRGKTHSSTQDSGSIYLHPQQYLQQISLQPMVVLSVFLITSGTYWMQESCFSSLISSLEMRYSLKNSIRTLKMAQPKARSPHGHGSPQVVWEPAPFSHTFSLTVTPPPAHHTSAEGWHCYCPEKMSGTAINHPSIFYKLRITYRMSTKCYSLLLP